jgi:ATP-dependent DNA helicase RecG
MDILELTEILARGEDSRNQFKDNIANVGSLAAELVAFSNSAGGRLIIGADDSGNLVGLSREDIARLNQLVSNPRLRARRSH